jgi:hypothetical protein
VLAIALIAPAFASGCGDADEETPVAPTTASPPTTTATTSAASPTPGSEERSPGGDGGGGGREGRGNDASPDPTEPASDEEVASETRDLRKEFLQAVREEGEDALADPHIRELREQIREIREGSEREGASGRHEERRGDEGKSRDERVPGAAGARGRED